MVNLHHGGEHTVVILTQQLRDNHLEDTQGVTDHDIIYLESIFLFNDTGRVFELFLLDSPTEATEEGADELRTREISAEGGVTLHLESRKNLTALIQVTCSITNLSMFTNPQALQLSDCVLIDITTTNTFSIFAEDDRAESYQALHEGRLVYYLLKRDGIEIFVV